jgi:hypothetical protein
MTEYGWANRKEWNQYLNKRMSQFYGNRGTGRYTLQEFTERVRRGKQWHEDLRQADLQKLRTKQEIYATGQAMAEGTSESSSRRRMEDASRSDESAD